MPTGHYKTTDTFGSKVFKKGYPIIRTKDIKRLTKKP